MNAFAFENLTNLTMLSLREIVRDYMFQVSGVLNAYRGENLRACSYAELSTDGHPVGFIGYLVAKNIVEEFYVVAKGLETVVDFVVNGKQNYAMGVEVSGNQE